MLTPRIALYALSRTRNKYRLIFQALPSDAREACTFLELDLGPVLFAGVLKRTAGHWWMARLKNRAKLLGLSRRQFWRSL